MGDVALAMRADAEVVQAGGRALHEVHVAEDAGGPPHVLVLDVGAVAVLQHLDHEQVVALVHGLGDVELRGEARALGHADEGAVHVELGVALHAVEADDLAGARGERGQRHDALVHARGVVGGHERLLDREREALIGVGELAVAVDLPQVRDLHLVPIGLVGRHQLRRHRLGRTEQTEAPRAAQLHEAARQLPAVRGGQLGRLVAHEVGAGGEPVAVGERGVLPIVDGIHRHVLLPLCVTFGSYRCVCTLCVQPVAHTIRQSTGLCNRLSCKRRRSTVRRPKSTAGGVSPGTIGLSRPFCPPTEPSAAGSAATARHRGLVVQFSQ